MSILLVILFSFAIFRESHALPEQGKWDKIMTEKNNVISIPKSLYKDSQLFIQVTCEQHQLDVNISIQWFLTQIQCWEYLYPQNAYMDDGPFPEVGVRQNPSNSSVFFVQSPLKIDRCLHGNHIVLDPAPSLAQAQQANPNPQHPKLAGEQPVFTIPGDGLYMLIMKIHPVQDTGSETFNVSVTVKMRGLSGYLSAVDWPLLPFYGAMCGVYVCLGVGWLMVCWLQWRDLLRIQFWIGAVLLLGMLEKATFYAEYSSINKSGVSVRGAVLAAEWMSVAKRALARMLVLIVSLGFGIVKPRLGPMLQRVVGVGAVWGALAALEAWMRIGGVEGAVSSDVLLAAAPLALLDAALCWWVFASLQHTTRTLRLRRNTVKLTLYKHFTNTLIFAVISSLIFMLYSIKAHSFVDCVTDWKELWVDHAYWHVLFSVVLLVIMILWRPTNNNQRYAFTPLLDNPDDDDDEEEQFVSDAYGVKMRGVTSNGDSSPLISPSSPLGPLSSHSHNSHGPLTPSQREEADLRWVEDNIPSAALPILDSDEEILNAKFEVSKMQ